MLSRKGRMVRARQAMRTRCCMQLESGCLGIARVLCDNDRHAKSPSVSKMKDPKI